MYNTDMLEVGKIYQWRSDPLFIKVLTEPSLELDPESKFYREYTFSGQNISTKIVDTYVAGGAWNEV